MPSLPSRNTARLPIHEGRTGRPRSRSAKPPKAKALIEAANGPGHIAQFAIQLLTGFHGFVVMDFLEMSCAVLSLGNE